MLKVLVVEDEDLIRTGIVLGTDWAQMNCEVVGQAANGQEGLEKARALKPDLIITDIKMPHMDGIEMVRRLREAGNEAKVIILTAYDSFSYAQSALRLGAVDYLLKPFHDGELEEAVLRVQGPAADARDPLSQFPKTFQSRYAQEVAGFIAGHYQEPEVSVGAIAGNLGISEGHLSHLFKKETGETILGYLTRYRIHRAMALLKDCRLKIYEVAEQVGYRDIAYFSATFKKLVGVSPSEYQNKGGRI